MHFWAKKPTVPMKCSNTSRFGSKGMKKGTHFNSVFDLNKNSYHSTGKGINYEPGQHASSILVTNKYEGDRYDQEKRTLYYEGSTYGPDNAALQKNIHSKTPVRVFVSHKANMNVAPQKGVVFLGMYRVFSVNISHVSKSGDLQRPLFVLVEKED